MTRLLGVLFVIGLYALARVTPAAPVVNHLIGALGSSHEDVSMAAYMALVKLGPKIAPRLLEEARQGRHTAKVVQVIGDQGDRSFIPELERFLRWKDTEVATAAADSIAALRQVGGPSRTV